jgi:hypothetical protein
MDRTLRVVKLFESIYAPLAAGLLQALAGDSRLQR